VSEYFLFFTVFTLSQTCINL